MTTVDRERIGFTPVIAKDLIGEVGSSSYPQIKVRIHMTLVTPANAKGPVPVLMMFSHAGFPAPNGPSDDELDRINRAWKALLVQHRPVPAPDFQSGGAGFQTRENASSCNDGLSALVRTPELPISPCARSGYSRIHCKAFTYGLKAVPCKA